MMLRALGADAMSRLRVCAAVLCATFLLATPAFADLKVAVGHFGIGTGAAASTVAVTGVGFQPKAVILFWNGRTQGTDTVAASHIRPGMGFFVSPTDRRALGAYSANAANPSDVGMGKEADECVVVPNAINAYDGWADCTSMDSDGFTLTIGDDFSQDYRIGYIALGGSDITNAKTGEFLTPTATGDLDITGLGFQPDTVLAISNAQGSLAEGVSASFFHGIHAAAGATPVSVSCAISSNDNVATADTRRYCRTGDFIASYSFVSGSFFSRGSLTSWLADGFRINFGTANATRRSVYYLAIKGAKFAVGDFLTQTDTVTDIVESGFGFSPSAVLVVSHNAAQSTAGAVQDHASLSVGAATSPTNRLALGVTSQDGTTGSTNITANEFDAVLVNIAAGATIAGLVDYKSKDADGFTFINDDADPSQNYALFWAIGPTTAAPSAGGGCIIGGGVACRGLIQ